jgi:hypothetical protein
VPDEIYERYAKSGPNLSRLGNRAYSGCGLSCTEKEEEDMSILLVYR